MSALSCTKKRQDQGPALRTLPTPAVLSPHRRGELRSPASFALQCRRAGAEGELPRSGKRSSSGGDAPAAHTSSALKIIHLSPHRRGGYYPPFFRRLSGAPTFAFPLRACQPPKPHLSLPLEGKVPSEARRMRCPSALSVSPSLDSSPKGRAKAHTHRTENPSPTPASINHAVGEAFRLPHPQTTPKCLPCVKGGGFRKAKPGGIVFPRISTKDLILPENRRLSTQKAA